VPGQDWPATYSYFSGSGFAGSAALSFYAESEPVVLNHHRHVDALQKLSEADFDHKYIRKGWPDHEGLFRFFQRESCLRCAGAHVGAAEQEIA